MLRVMDSGSLSIECQTRLTNLYNESHHWLVRHSMKITKNREEAEDLVQELYEYLHNKCNPKIFWGTAYHMFYCYRFLESRWINKVKKLNKVVYQPHIQTDEIVEEYDEIFDSTMQQAHDDVVAEIKKLKNTRMFAPAMIFELYWCSDDTLEQVAKKIGISKSTVYLSVRKIRRYLKEVINNPFDEQHTQRNL
jgi:RNA polymerase sigma factor (sigma-70 family)